MGTFFPFRVNSFRFFWKMIMKCYKDNKIFVIDLIFAENFAQKVAFLEQRGEKIFCKKQ
jgi:hypothetical protein